MTSDLSNSNEWQSPAHIVERRHRRFRFTLDAAAADWNAQCARYFTEQTDALKRIWRGRVWCNPPYKNGLIYRFVEHARLQVLRGHAEVVDQLVPLYPGEGWWQEFVRGAAGPLVRFETVAGDLGTVDLFVYRDLAIEITAVRKRLYFRPPPWSNVRKLHTARFGSALVAFMRPALVEADWKRFHRAVA